MTRSHPLRAAAFPAVAIAIVGFLALLAARLESFERPGALAVGITLDLTLTLPVAFYFLVARGRGWSPLTAVPVALLGFFAARGLLPAEHRSALHVADVLLVPAELAVLGTIAWRARRAFAAARGEAGAATTDPVERLAAAAREIVPSARVAQVLATELAVLYYGLLAWRATPHVPAGCRPIAVHRRSNHGAFLTALVVLGIAEGIALHLLLGLWSPTAAWIATALGAYTLLWLVADYRATVLRPWLVDRRFLHVRAGLRWRAAIPLEQVEGVVALRPDEPAAALSSAFLATPTRWIVLRERHRIEGLYGFARQARVIGLVPDSVEVLDEIGR